MPAHCAKMAYETKRSTKLSRAHIEKNAACVMVAGALLNSGDRNLQHQTGPTGVGDSQVAAAFQDQKREILRAREGNGLLDLSVQLGLHQKTGWATDTESGRRSQWDVFLGAACDVFNIHRPTRSQSQATIEVDQ